MSKYLGIIFIAVCGLLASCDKTSPAKNISNNVYITVLNEEGEDLLNPDSPSSISLDQIRVYYELDGVKTEINRGNLDSPKMFTLRQPSDISENYRIFLFLNSEDDSDITTTYLEWSSDRTDIFKSQVNRSSSNNKYALRTWLNDELICDFENLEGDCSVVIMME